MKDKYRVNLREVGELTFDLLVKEGKKDAALRVAASLIRKPNSIELTRDKIDIEIKKTVEKIIGNDHTIEESCPGVFYIEFSSEEVIYVSEEQFNELTK